MSITLNTLLDGTTIGNPQSVGYLSILPILDTDNSVSDETFGPPNVHIGTSNYGTVNLRNNDSQRPTIMPTGSSWITKEHAQDHAIPGAKLMKPLERAIINTARCIEPNQSGMISMGEHEFSILPMQLRKNAVMSRKIKGYNTLWNSLSEFNKSSGVSGNSLAAFEGTYKKELDEFVAEFELVPHQIGAIVFLNESIIGIERAPTVEFWTKIWVPLIRMCYGSVAIYARHKGLPPPAFRQGLTLTEKTLQGVKKALKVANESFQTVLKQLKKSLKTMELGSATTPDDRYSNYRLLTVGTDRFTGQIVTDPSLKKVPYVSVCGA